MAIDRFTKVILRPVADVARNVCEFLAPVSVSS